MLRARVEEAGGGASERSLAMTKTENEIRHGVGDVKYSIVIADCLSFIVTETELFPHIIPDHANT